MTSRHQVAMDQFLAAHQEALADITFQAYAAAGGHYLALSEAERRQQAASDAREWTAALRTQSIDQAAIGRVVVAGGTQALMEDIVRMSTTQERLFVQLVEASLPRDPELARALQQRARQAGVRFRMALTAAGMTEAVRQAGIARPARPEGDPPAG